MELFGIGTDIVEIERMERSIVSNHFMERVFSKEEIIIINSKGSPSQTAAANFCAKEALGKALGTGVRGFKLIEVAVLRDDLGKPYFKLIGSAEVLAQKLGLSFQVTLSHCKEYAVAFVIAYKI